MLGSGGYLFFNRNDRSDITNARESLGSVKPVGADIRIKGDTDVSWSPVSRDANVFSNDRVFTGEKSAAKVKLKNLENFTVEPNSPILISDENKKSAVNLSAGGFLTNIRKGVTLLVKYKGRETNVTSDGATIRLGASGDDLNLVVLHGEANVTNASKSTEPQVVKANEELKISAGGQTQMTTHAVTLLSPEPAATLWDDGKPVEFAWSPSLTKSMRLEVSQDPEFKADLQTITVEGENATTLLKPSATYFWRIVGEEPGSDQSPVSSFSLNPLTPPQLEKEKMEFHVKRDDKGRFDQSATLLWKDLVGSDFFRIETSVSSDFHDIKDAIEVEKTEFALNRLQEGTLYWRVTSKAKNRPDLISQTGIINVIVDAPVLAPREPAQVPPETPTTLVPAPPTSLIPSTTTTLAPTTTTVAPPPPVSVTPPAQLKVIESILKPVSNVPPSESVQVRALELPPVPLVIPQPPAPRELPPVPRIDPPVTAPLPQATASAPPKRPPIGLKLFAGVGATYFAYQENLFDVQTSYHSLPTESWNFGANFEVTDKVDVGVSLRSTDLSFDNSSVGLSTTHAQWQIMTLEGSSRSNLLFTPAPNTNLPYISEFRWLWGLQLHQIPLALFENSGNLPTLRNVDLINLSLGGSYVRYLNPWTRASILMHFQYPLSASPTSSGATFTVTSPFIFDGSIGIEKNISEHAWLGLHWLGQYNDLHFNYSDPQVTEHGEHSAIFSTVEMRLLFDY